MRSQQACVRSIANFNIMFRLQRIKLKITTLEVLTILKCARVRGVYENSFQFSSSGSHFYFDGKAVRTGWNNTEHQHNHQVQSAVSEIERK